MTLILAIPAVDGVVVASDSQVTAGMIRQRVKKLKQLGASGVWGASGSLALIQRIEERIGNYEITPPLEAFRDEFASIVREMVTTVLRSDFRTQFLPNDPDTLLDLHPADFLVADFRDGQPRILHVLTNGISEWVNDNPYASGNGSVFAYALLQRYEAIIPEKITVKRAALLAYRVLFEAIEVGSYGLGQPIDVWQITEDGAVNYTEDQIASLEDAYKILLDTEIQLLLGSGK